MPDVLTPQQRSHCMSQIKGRNTTPEHRARSIIHRLGYRFRLHRRNLPGRPDLVFPKLRSVIFINGCFWHRHPGCRYATTPKTNGNFWEKKLGGNAQRDKKNLRALRRAGWRALTLWECQLKNPTDVARKVVRFLGARQVPPP